MGIILREIIEQELCGTGLQLSQDSQDRRGVMGEMCRAAPDVLLNVKIEKEQVCLIRRTVRAAISKIGDCTLCQEPDRR
ncbi:hypothetical protein HZC21_00270 [Candidatus Peregrinibacteria bacterium]|nr:hypothetical protein [Candidatus Peregrinibacteria bacterium]